MIDTPMKAYILGLLTADGSVSKAGQVTLGLHEKDRSIVESVRDEIAPDARITSYITRTTPMVRFSVSAPELIADLADHGVINAKSLITAWPAKLHPSLENSYVCGYFDGDGSLGIYNTSKAPHYTNPILRWSIVSGNREFLVVMQDRIRLHTGVYVGGPYQDKRHEAAWSIVATGERVRALDAWIHKDVPGLARKSLRSKV